MSDNYAALRDALKNGAEDAFYTHPRDSNKAKQNEALAIACTAETLSALLAERDALAAERDAYKARLDRALKSAQEHFGEDCIRYKFSLFKNGRCMNHFPDHIDGNWYALQRADDDAHLGLASMLAEAEAERDALRADAERWRAFRTCRKSVKLYLYSDEDDPTSGEWETKIEPETFDRFADAAREGVL